MLDFCLVPFNPHCCPPCLPPHLLYSLSNPLSSLLNTPIVQPSYHLRCFEWLATVLDCVEKEVDTDLALVDHAGLALVDHAAAAFSVTLVAQVTPLVLTCYIPSHTLPN